MSKVAVWKLDLSGHRQHNLQKVLFNGNNPTSLNSASKMIPCGVYTTFRTYQGNKILPLDAHIRRLEESACLVGSPISIQTQPVMETLHAALQDFQSQETRIRLTVDLEHEPGDLYVSMEPLRIPSPEDYERGVFVVTCRFQREVPRAKQTNFISFAESIQRELPDQANEGLLTDEAGQILEGMSSNFFAVQGGELWTAEEEILPGITRSIVLRTARRQGIQIRLESVSVQEIAALDEAFLTSSSRSVLPIRRIDRTLIGDGNPGPVTEALADAFWQEIQQALIEI